MGYIKKLKNNELVGGTDKHTIYPVTSAEAVFEEVSENNFQSQKSINVDRLQRIETLEAHDEDHEGRVSTLEEHDSDHESRVQELEEIMPDTIKSITINGSKTKTYTVDDKGNVDLTIYSDGGQDYEGLTEVVADLRDIVGENPEEPQSGTLLERVDTLEDAVGTGGSVDERINRAIYSYVFELNQDTGHLWLTYDGVPNYTQITLGDKFRGKRCAIIGDSISTFQGTMPSGYANYYPQGNVTSVDHIWWKIVCDTLGMTPVNCSWSGSRVSGNPKGDASAACSDQRILVDAKREGNPDIILFFISCNDWGNEVDLGNWSVDNTIVSGTSTISEMRAAYSLMINKAQKAYPNAKLYCCTILDDAKRDEVDGYPSTNGKNVSTYTWNQSIKQIADAMGVDVIDLHACGLNYANIANFVVDSGLHPNKAGHYLMAQKAISELIAK